VEWHLANLEFANAACMGDLSLAYWDQVLYHGSLVHCTYSLDAHIDTDHTDRWVLTKIHVVTLCTGFLCRLAVYLRPCRTTLTICWGTTASWKGATGSW